MTIDPVTLAITVALDAASMALAASKKIEGPRVADLSASVADYGTPLNYLYGTRRLECPCFYCEPITEKKHHTKTKGGKYTEYRYFGTFAMLFADQAITRYSRIWFDRHLVYDITGSGEEVEEPNDHSTLSEYMRLYVGDQTTPDPRMVAYITEKEGADRTPAYLDISYVMFEGLPLEFLGNRFPQVSIEGNGGGGPVQVFTSTPFTLQVQGSGGGGADGNGNFRFNMIPTSSVNFSFTVVAHDNLGNTDEIGIDAAFINNTVPYNNSLADPLYPGDTREFDSGVGKYRVTFPLDLRTADGGYTVIVESDRPLTFDPFEATNDGNLHFGWAITTLGTYLGEPDIPRDWDPMPTLNDVPLSSYQYYYHDFNIQEPDEVQGSLDIGISPPPEAVPITLGLICADIARRSAMDIADYDFSNLDQLIYGFSWTIGQGKQIIDPLLDIYDSDICLHDFQLIGRKRGGADDGDEIDFPFLVRQSRADSSQQPLYQIIMAAESDLPRRVFATFADRTADQQPNTAVAQRNAVSTATFQEVPVDVTNLALSPDEAQPLAERWLRRKHIGATSFLYTAPPGELALECADLRVSNLDGQQLRGRVTRLVIRADRSIQTEWEVDSVVGALDGNISNLFNSPGSPTLGRPPSVIFSPEASRAFILDIPLVSDADDQTTPFVYLTAGRKAQGGTFPGSEIQQSDTGVDGTWVAGWDSVNSNAEALWGECENVLGDALPWIPDRANVLVVNMPNGSLESAADAYLNANPTANLAAIGSHAAGWEIVQFGDAVVQSEGIWHLSNFYRRGVKGTEALIATHGAGEQFVLLQSLVKHDLGAGEIGDTDYYRSATNTTDPDEADQVSVDFSAQAHRPLSPVHVNLSRDAGSGDWSGTFVRRSRIGGGSVNGQDVPLGEASESYRVKIMNGLSVARTITVSSPSFTYPAADQTTDFGSHQLTLTVAISQYDTTLSIEGAATTATA